MPGSDWNSKGAALSDKTAIMEYGLTQEQIYEAVRKGELQYRQNHVHGNPYLRLLRCEVEELVKRTQGDDFLKQQKLETELKSVKSQIREMKTKINRLEKRKAELLGILGDGECR